jgi:lipopolysaccharide/colanic/teichoic acid biosynthesis glycosyltransferase
MNIIHSREEFHRMLVRERALCDRNEHRFSLLVFYGPVTTVRQSVRALMRILTRRVRQADEIGWFDEQSVGILLPFTASEGARILAEDICSQLSGVHATYTIYTYPGNWFPATPGVGGTAASDNRIPVWKRAVDIAGSLLALFCLAPLFLAIALVIKVVSPGPALLKQQRLGQDGKPFTLWKFRTMRPNADAGIHQNHLTNLIETDEPMTKLDVKRDPRIFPFGRLLRRSCLDELPQFINVLRGDMSLVGPRPCLPYEAEAYLLWQTARFDTAPGMTGLWQVSGKNRTTFKEMMRLDIRYARTKTLSLDLYILLKTPIAIASEVASSLRRIGWANYSG